MKLFYFEINECIISFSVNFALEYSEGVTKI